MRAHTFTNYDDHVRQQSGPTNPGIKQRHLEISPSSQLNTFPDIHTEPSKTSGLVASISRLHWDPQSTHISSSEDENRCVISRRNSKR